MWKVLEQIENQIKHEIMKYWYFVAVIILNEKWEITYDGYVTHTDGFFPVNTAKLQAVDYAEIPPEDFPPEQDKKILMKFTTIVNQVEVSESAFSAWKIANKF